MPSQPLETRVATLEQELTQIKHTLSQITTPNRKKWGKFAGIFKDDPDFQSIIDSIHAERNSEDNSEIDPSYYQ
jgi:hypothetical protein